MHLIPIHYKEKITMQVDFCYYEGVTLYISGYNLLFRGQSVISTTKFSGDIVKDL